MHRRTAKPGPKLARIARDAVEAAMTAEELERRIQWAKAEEEQARREIAPGRSPADADALRLWARKMNAYCRRLTRLRDEGPAPQPAPADSPQLPLFT